MKSGKICKEEAYLLGALRDASIDLRKGKNYEIKIAQKNIGWLKFIQKLFKNTFRMDGKISKHVNNTNILRIYGRENVAKILKISEMKIPQIKWGTPKIIKLQSKNIKEWYIKGFFDAEGGMPKSKKSTQKYLSFDQRNKEAIKFIRDSLIEEGFTPTNLTFTGGDWQFRLTRKNEIINFYNQIGTLHPEKKKRFKILVGSSSP